MVCELKKKTTVDDLNAAFKEAAKKDLKGILEYTEDPIVSSDVIGNPLDVIASGPTVGPAGSSADARGMLRQNGLWNALPDAVRTLLEAPARPRR